MANQSYVQPMNMSNMGNMNSYQTPPGAFYTTPAQQNQHACITITLNNLYNNRNWLQMIFNKLFLTGLVPWTNDLVN